MQECRKILFITDLFEVMGGAERNVMQIMTNLDRAKFDPILCCLKAGALATLLREQGFSVFDLDVKRIYSPHSLSKLVFLLRLARNERVKLIVTYHESSDFLGFAVSKLSGIPILSSKRDMGFALGKHHILIYRLIGRFFDAVIAVSDAVKKEVATRDWIPASMIFTVHNGVDPDKYKARVNIEDKKKDLGLEPNRPVVGLIAGLRRIKGISYFLEAASFVLKDVTDVQFIIVGNDPGEPGSTRKELEELSTRLGISRHVQFLGKRADIREILCTLDISVICSLSEGFSNVVVESMAAGKPVVATDVGGNPEAVIDGKTGFLVPAADPSALAKKIVFLLKDEALARSMGNAARDRVENHFTLQKMVRDNAELYNFVIERHKTRRRARISRICFNTKEFLISTMKVCVSGILYYSGFVNSYLFARRLLRAGTVKILAYHNISDTFPPYLDISQSVACFDKQLIFLKENYYVLPLNEGLDKMCEKTEHINAVVLTFDDCYKEFRTNVFPLLQAYELTATVFLTSGPIESGLPLTVDLLIHAVSNTKRLVLDLAHFGLRRYLLCSREEKETAIFEINEYSKRLDRSERFGFIKDMFSRLDVDFQDVRQSNMVLNWDDIRQMSNGGITFGAHTLTHPNLAEISFHESKEEIVQSKHLMEKSIGLPVLFFAYPYGGHSDFNSEIVDLVRSSGFRAAFTLGGDGEAVFGAFSLPRTSVSRGMYSGPLGGFSNALFATELSGLGHYAFFRFLVRRKGSGRK